MYWMRWWKSGAKLFVDYYKSVNGAVGLISSNMSIFGSLSGYLRNSAALCSKKSMWVLQSSPVFNIFTRSAKWIKGRKSNDDWISSWQLIKLMMAKFSLFLCLAALFFHYCLNPDLTSVQICEWIFLCLSLWVTFSFNAQVLSLLLQR